MPKDGGSETAMSSTGFMEQGETELPSPQRVMKRHMPRFAQRSIKRESLLHMENHETHEIGGGARASYGDVEQGTRYPM